MDGFSAYLEGIGPSRRLNDYADFAPPHPLTILPFHLPLTSLNFSQRDRMAIPSPLHDYRVTDVRGRFTTPVSSLMAP